LLHCSQIIAMPKFRRKPVIVEAIRWFPHNYDEIVQPYPDADDHCGRPCNMCGQDMHDHGWIVDTVNNNKFLVCPGNWVVADANGEHYPMSPDKFAEMYDPLDENDVLLHTTIRDMAKSLAQVANRLEFLEAFWEWSRAVDKHHFMRSMI